VCTRKRPPNLQEGQRNIRPIERCTCPEVIAIVGTLVAVVMALPLGVVAVAQRGA
jgi:hypothetical protein